MIKIITPLGDAGTAKYFQEELKAPLSCQEMLAEMDAYALPLYRDKILFKDGVKEYLQTAKRAGLYCVGVYDKSSEEYGLHLQADADKYFGSFENESLL